MLAIALSPKTWLGFALGILLSGAWAVLVHGPAQYDAGGIAKASELSAATNTAMQEISDEADRAAFRRRQCRELGQLYEFSTGRCLPRPAE